MPSWRNRCTQNTHVRAQRERSNDMTPKTLGIDVLMVLLNHRSIHLIFNWNLSKNAGMLKKKCETFFIFSPGQVNIQYIALLVIQLWYFYWSLAIKKFEIQNAKGIKQMSNNSADRMEIETHPLANLKEIWQSSKTFCLYPCKACNTKIIDNLIGNRQRNQMK